MERARYAALKLADFVLDARAVLKVLRQHPLVDASRVFVLGWSEGALVGAQVALEEAGLRGLVMIGPPVVIQGQETGLLGQAARLRTPVLVLQGQSDEIIPDEREDFPFQPLAGELQSSAHPVWFRLAHLGDHFQNTKVIPEKRYDTV